MVELYLPTQRNGMLWLCICISTESWPHIGIRKINWSHYRLWQRKKRRVYLNMLTLLGLQLFLSRKSRKLMGGGAKLRYSESTTPCKTENSVIIGPVRIMGTEKSGSGVSAHCLWGYNNKQNPRLHLLWCSIQLYLAVLLPGPMILLLFAIRCSLATIKFYLQPGMVAILGYTVHINRFVHSLAI